MYVCGPPAYLVLPQRTEESVGPYGAGGTNGCEPAWECREPNPRPLQEKHVLFAIEHSL